MLSTRNLFIYTVLFFFFVSLQELTHQCGNTEGNLWGHVHPTHKDAPFVFVSILRYAQKIYKLSHMQTLSEDLHPIQVIIQRCWDLRERLLYFSSQLLKLPVFISSVPYPLFLAPHPNNRLEPPWSPLFDTFKGGIQTDLEIWTF